MGTLCKKLISLSLIFILLINSNVELFATIPTINESSMTAMRQDLNKIITSNLAEQAKKTVSGQVNELCSSLTLCMMLSGEEPTEDFDPSINLLYMDDATAENFLQLLFGDNIPIDKELLALDREQEKESLKEIKARVRNIWKNRKELKGKTLVKYFSYLIPALYLADTSDIEFREYFKYAYSLYLGEIRDDVAVNIFSQQITIKDVKGERQKELLGLGDILTGYSLVKGSVEENDLITELAVYSARSELSTIVVPSYITLLLEAEQFDLLEKYIDRLGWDEVRSSDNHAASRFWGVLKDISEALSVSSYVKLGWNSSSSYAPGAVSRNGYYWDNNKKLHNMWEELPAVIASYGPEGEKLLNKIFYKDLVIAHSGRLQPHAEWNKAIIPFMIGAIGTNKIKARPYKDIEEGGKEYSLARYYGANIVGMVELGLLSYKFYDVPSYEYYEHVRNIIAAPYWKEIQGKENKVRHNFAVRSHLSSQKGEFIGGVYNPENKTGLILHNSQNAWLSGRNVLDGELKAAGIADTAIGIYFTYQLALTAAGLAQMVGNGIKLLKAAKSLKALGQKGNLLKIARGIRKGKYDYLINQPKAAQAKGSAVTQVQAPKLGVTAEAKPQGVEGLLGNKSLTVDLKTGKITAVKKPEPQAEVPSNWLPLKRGDGFNPQTGEYIPADGTFAKGTRFKVDLKTGEKTQLKPWERVDTEGNIYVDGSRTQGDRSTWNSRQSRRNAQKGVNSKDDSFIDIKYKLVTGLKKQVKIADFQSKNWFARKWTLLQGKYVPEEALTPFELQLAKFANKYRTPLYFVTHPAQTVMGVSPAVASGVSVANAPMQLAPAVEAVQMVSTPGMVKIPTGQVASTVGKGGTVNLGQTLPNINFNGVNLASLPYNSPLAGSLSGTATWFDNPFVALRKNDILGGYISGYDFTKMYKAGDPIDLSEYNWMKAHYSKEEQVQQTSAKANADVNNTKTNEKQGGTILDNILGTQNTVRLAQIQRQKELLSWQAAAATIAAAITLGLGGVADIASAIGTTLAMALIGVPGDNIDPAKEGKKENSERPYYSSLQTFYEWTRNPWWIPETPKISSDESNYVFNLPEKPEGIAKPTIKESSIPVPYTDQYDPVSPYDYLREKFENQHNPVYIHSRALRAYNRSKDWRLIRNICLEEVEYAKGLAKKDENSKEFGQLKGELFDLAIAMEKDNDVPRDIFVQIRDAVMEVSIAARIKWRDDFIMSRRDTNPYGYMWPSAEEPKYPENLKHLVVIVINDMVDVVDTAANQIRDYSDEVYVAYSIGDLGEVIAELQKQNKIPHYIVNDMNLGWIDTEYNARILVKQSFPQAADKIGFVMLTDARMGDDYFQKSGYIARVRRSDGDIDFAHMGKIIANIEEKLHIQRIINNIQYKHSEGITKKKYIKEIWENLDQLDIAGMGQDLDLSEFDIVAIGNWIENPLKKEGVTNGLFISEKEDLLNYVQSMSSKKKVFIIGDINQATMTYSQVKDLLKDHLMGDATKSIFIIRGVNNDRGFEQRYSERGFDGIFYFSYDKIDQNIEYNILDYIAYLQKIYADDKENVQNQMGKIIKSREKGGIQNKGVDKKNTRNPKAAIAAQRNNRGRGGRLLRTVLPFVLPVIGSVISLISGNAEPLVTLAALPLAGIGKKSEDVATSSVTVKTKEVEPQNSTEDEEEEDKKEAKATGLSHEDFVRFHDETRTPWKYDEKWKMAQLSYDEISELEDLIKEAEKYGLEHEIAVEWAYGKDFTEARRLLTDFIMFNKVGDQEIERSKKAAKENRFKARDLTKFVRDRYEEPFNEESGDLSILFITGDPFITDDIKDFKTSKNIEIFFVDSYTKAQQLITQNPGKYNFVFSDNFFDMPATEKMQKLVKEQGNIPFVLYSAEIIPDKDILAPFDGFISAQDNNLNEALNYASNFNVKTESDIPGFVAENYIPLYYDKPFDTSVKGMRILIANDAESVSKDMTKFLMNSPLAKYVETIDFAANGNEAIKKLIKNPKGYDIVFADYLMGTDSVGRDISEYVYLSDLDIPVIFMSDIGYNPEDMFVRDHFAGSLNIRLNDPESILSYASNFLVRNKQTQSKPELVFNEENYVYEDYEKPLNTNVKPMNILVVNDVEGAIWMPPPYKVDNPFAKYVDLFNYVPNFSLAKQVLTDTPHVYDIIFVDSYIDEGSYKDFAQFVYENNLDIPVILYANNSYGARKLFNEHVSGFMDPDGNDYDQVVSYASNMLVARGKTKQAEQNKTKQTEQNGREKSGIKDKTEGIDWDNLGDFLHKLALPIISVGIAGASLALGNDFSATSLVPAFIPTLFSTVSLNRQVAKLPKEMQDFIKLRKKLNPQYFRNKPLTGKEPENMERILGTKFFKLWQTFYNKDLKQMAIENPELIAELIKYSNQFENVLPSLNRYRFDGTNPLFVFTMKEITDKFIADLKTGKINMEQAIKGIGDAMFEYHKKMYQIEAFVNLRNNIGDIDWNSIENPDIYNTVFDGTETFEVAHRIGFGKLNTSPNRNVSLYVTDMLYSEYVNQLFFNYDHPKTYKGVDLVGRISVDPGKGVELDYPNNTLDKNGLPNNVRAFMAIQKDWEILKPLSEKYDRGEGLTEADIKTIHNTIADISYIFANAVPFHRGSASANLVMVYGLYKMFGINAPQVKQKKALDLESFGPTPENYKEIWPSLFNGEFPKEIVPVNAKSENNTVKTNKQTNIQEGTNTQVNVKPEKDAPKESLMDKIKDVLQFALPFVAPVVSLGLGLVLGSPELGLSVAAIPIIGGVMPSKEEIEIDSKIQKFINLRKNLDKTLFKGDNLTADEINNLTRILGDKFFNDWQMFYSKYEDLNEMAKQNPKLTERIANLSNMFESTLPREIGSRFPGTNPLYLLMMEEVMQGLEQDLFVYDKSMREAVTNMGKKMFEYHKKINQIKKFFELKRRVKLGEDRAINWHEIENLKEYNKDGMQNLNKGLPNAYNIGFGVIPETGSPGVTIFGPNDTYWDELIDPNNVREGRYDGVDLSDVVTIGHYPHIISAKVVHPIGVANINKLFEVLQQHYNAIKPIIKRVQKGETLNDKDIEILHENIAKISYLFANAKPFYRGTASGNLALVHLLYRMAGIKVPSIKIGRELDWSAFAMNGDPYVKNWLNLFDGEFTIINKVGSNSGIGNINRFFAKKLFDWDYKDNSFPKIKAAKNKMEELLPQSFKESNFFYKSMVLDIGSYRDLQDILKYGLSIYKVKEDGIIKVADKAVNSLPFAKRFQYGVIPVMVKIRPVEQIKKDVLSFFTGDFYSQESISAKNIEEVRVYAEIDGKIGWYQAVLDNNGEVVLQSTDDMKTADVSVKQEGLEISKFFLPAVTIGLSIWSLIHPELGSFALAAGTGLGLASTFPIGGSVASTETKTQTQNPEGESFSADILFTDEYKEIAKSVNISEDMLKNLPPGFEEQQGVLYRGMSPLTLEDFEGVPKDGLPGSKVKDPNAEGKVYFTDNVARGIGYSLLYGDVPILIKTRKKRVGFFDSWGAPIYAYDNFPKEDISDILVWAKLEKDGKAAWWKVELDENGKIILKEPGDMTVKPIDLQAGGTPSDSDVHTGNNSIFSRFKSILKKYILPSIGIGLFVSSLINPAAASVAMAALPFVIGVEYSPRIDKRTQQFINLHKQFVPNLFAGAPLAEDSKEALALKEALNDEGFFHLWYELYGQNLEQIAEKYPELIEEIVKWENIFGTHLPSEIDTKYGGSNPLFALAMRDIKDNLITNLQSEQDIKTVIEKLGQDINVYHYKVAQIKLFQKYRNEGSEITVEKLTDKSALLKNFMAELYFGKFRITDRFNFINSKSYPEYLQDMLNSPDNRKSIEKGVKLSTISKSPANSRVTVNIPSFMDQKEVFFKALENELKYIKALIEKRNTSGKWNKFARKALDNSIATIAYLFANVMPFQRGSASATTALVYALYEMAGIHAPQVKEGRALDLSAFAMTLTDYIKNWRNLFDGEFTNIQININFDPNVIPAKKMFTHAYKNARIFLDDPINMYYNLPSGFEEEGAFYRGMILRNYKFLKWIFTKGLSARQTKERKIYCSDLVKEAIDYSLPFLPRYNVPILIKIKGYKKPIPVTNKKNEFTFDNVAPEDIAEVLVWDKVVWRRAVLNDNGKVILQAVENIMDIETPAVTVKPEQNTIFKEVKKAENVKAYNNYNAEAYAVWALLDEQDKPLYYLKYTNKEEFDRTNQYIYINDDNKLPDKYSIGIHFPRIVPGKISDLPQNVISTINEDLKNISSKIRDFEDRSEIVLITTPVNTSGFVLGNRVKRDRKNYDHILNLESLMKEALNALRGEPITQEEWQQIVNYIKDLERAGFIHGDLIHNLFFWRDDSGKLNITLLYFEWNEFLGYINGLDVEDLELMKKDMEAIGAIERDETLVVQDENYENQQQLNLLQTLLQKITKETDFNNLKSLLFPAIGLGLTFAFKGLDIHGTGLALAASTGLLLSSTFPIGFESGDLISELDIIRDSYDRRHTIKSNQKSSENKNSEKENLTLKEKYPFLFHNKQEENSNQSFKERYSFLFSDKEQEKDNQSFEEKYSFLFSNKQEENSNQSFKEKYSFLFSDTQEEKDDRPFEEKYPFLFEQNSETPLTFDDLEERFIGFFYPEFYKNENVILPNNSKIKEDREQNNSPLLEIAIKWNLPRFIQREYLEDVLWDFGMPIRAIKKVSLPGLWLLYRLYFRLQIGREITSYHDNNLEAKAKKISNIFDIFSGYSNKPEFVYVYIENENVFQIIPLPKDGRSATVGTDPTDPFEPPWDSFEYVDNVIILGQSIPIFKASKKISRDLNITDKDVNPDSPILKYVTQYDDPNITEEQILNDPIFHSYYATDGNVYNHSAILQMIKKSERKLSDTTDDFRAFGYQESAIYRPERKELHDEIISKIFNGYENKISKNPTFIVLGGRAGSGKTTFFEGKVYDKEHYLFISADEIRAMLPEYEGYNSSSLHQESIDVMDRALRLAAQLHVNVVLEFTMNSIRTLKRRLQMFKDAGYRTEAHYMFVPRQEAAKRALMRFLNNPDGRYVAIKTVLNMKNGEQNFDAIKDFVDAWSFIDNNVPYGQEPKLVASKGTFSYKKYQNKVNGIFKKYILPTAVTLGFLAAALTNPITAPFAMAAGTGLLLSSTFPITSFSLNGNKALKNYPNSNKDIIAFGDSLTFGYGAEPNESYPAQLGKMLGREIINLGVAGNTSTMGLARVGELEKYSPYMVLIWFSGNDFFNNISLEETEKNLREIVKKVQDMGAIAVVIDTGFMQSYTDMQKRIAEDYNALFVQGIFDDILMNKSLKSDRIHPNAAGYKMIASKINAAIKEYITPNIKSSADPEQNTEDKKLNNVKQEQSTEKSLNLKTDIVGLVERIDTDFVFGLRDSDRKIRAFYKNLEQKEIDRTKQFAEMVSKLRDKYSIGIEYPEILSTSINSLSDKVAASIKAKLSHGFRYPKQIIMTAVNTSGYAFYKSKVDALPALKGQPITNEEWNQVVSLFTDLNNAGFYHTDLGNNMFFRRDDNGKLIVTVIDFEDLGVHNDMQSLEKIRVALESAGAKEKSPESSFAPEDTLKQRGNQFLSKLPSWVLPAVGVGLLTATLSNPITTPLALATLPLLASTDNPLASKNDTNTKQEAISAKVLFTSEYKNKNIYFSWKDIKHLRSLLPSGFEAEDAIYRGMTYSHYTDLKETFKGLPNEKTEYKEGVYFSSNVEYAIGCAAKFAYGHVPVLVKTNLGNRERAKKINFPDGIKAEDILEILVWAEIDGKLGWWKAELDDEGEVILKYTGMETLKGYGTFTVTGGGII